MGLSLLPVVKAYPVIDPVSQTEAVCVAGISMARPHRWIRLFPLDYRGLLRAQRFKKYEAIELEAHKSTKDSRPESFTPVLDSITIGEFIDTDNGTWRRRKRFLDDVEDESMCEIQRRQKSERKSLGLFRPLEVTDLKVTAAEKGFADAQRALLDHASLFGDSGTGRGARTATSSSTSYGTTSSAYTATAATGAIIASPSATHVHPRRSRAASQQRS